MTPAKAKFGNIIYPSAYTTVLWSSKCWRVSDKMHQVSNQETLQQSQFLTFDFPKCLPDHCRALTLANVTFSDAKCCVEKKSKWLSGRSQLSSCTSKAHRFDSFASAPPVVRSWGKFTSVLFVALPAGEPNSEPFLETIHVAYLCELPRGSGA